MQMHVAPQPTILTGVGAAHGFAVGRALRLARGASSGDASAPPLAFAHAIARVRRDLERLLAGLPRDEAELFEPEVRILDEIEPRLLAREVEGQVREEAVFEETSCGCTDLVIDLRERLLVALTGVSYSDADASLAHHASDLVLLADVVTPSMLALLPKQVVAVLAGADENMAARRDVGRASHAAILARGRGVPLVYLSRDLLSAIPLAAWLVIESSEVGARITIDPGDASLETARWRRESRARQMLQAAREPLDHLGIALRVNVSSAYDDVPASAEGIGLVRTEMMFSGSVVAPSEDDQLAALLRLASKAKGAPVVVRLFDAAPDKPLPWLGGTEGTSRGIARLLAHPRLLSSQLRALERARERADVRVLLPFVESADEVRAVRGRLGLALPVGAMVESPRAVEAIDAIAADADFISLGTNDLTAAALGRERTQGLPLVDEGVLALVKRAIDGAHAAGREVTVCGEIAGDERGARLVVGLGADAISMAPPRAVIVRSALARTTSETCRAEAERTLSSGPGSNHCCGGGCGID